MKLLRSQNKTHLFEEIILSGAYLCCVAPLLLDQTCDTISTYCLDEHRQPFIKRIDSTFIFRTSSRPTNPSKKKHRVCALSNQSCSAFEKSFNRHHHHPLLGRLQAQHQRLLQLLFAVRSVITLVRIAQGACQRAKKD